MRVYLPATLTALADALKSGEIGPAPLPAYAVTPALREWYADGDLEELEYVAMAAAARASLRLLAADPDAPARRVVVVVEVPDDLVGRGSAAGSLGTEETRAVVRLSAAVPTNKIVSGHVDDPVAEPDVRAAIAALPGADAGDDDARFTVDGAEGHELMWYATQELPLPSPVSTSHNLAGAMTHIVWDWNGTLFDDTEPIVMAHNEVFAPYGLAPITLPEFRAVYTRPIWRCYERVLGRSLTDGEWERLDLAFHTAYDRLIADCGLVSDAQEALDALALGGNTQSLLSMWLHERLVPTVEQLGLSTTFHRVDGLRSEAAGGGKAEFLVRHVAALGVDPAEVVVVGDSVDDALAAHHVRARAVLYAGGLTARTDLERVGVPVVDRLADVRAYI